MRELVLDASVVLKWFRSEGERHIEQARRLRAEFEAGDLLAFAPPLLLLEIVNVAGRRWRFGATQLDELAAALPGLGLELVEPDLRVVARWTAHGLTAYDASYLAVAEQTGAPLISDDEDLCRPAPQLTGSLSAVRF